MSYTRLVPGHRWTRITLGAVLLLGLTAPINCTSDTPDPIVAPPPPPPRACTPTVQSLAIQPLPGTSVADGIAEGVLGADVGFSAVPQLSCSGAPPSPGATWSVDDIKVIRSPAGRENTGYYRAVGAGRATITAEWGGQRATVVVQVGPAPSMGPLVVVSAGDFVTCALDAAAKTFCWGTNLLHAVSDSGAIGLCETGACRPIPLLHPTPGPVIQVDARGEGVCALVDGAPSCWPVRYGPHPVNASTRFRQLSKGLNHACGLDSDGIAFCWGSNGLGQLGDSSRVTRSGPVRVFGTERYATISAGANSTCALTAEGVLYCWGEVLQGVESQVCGIRGKTSLTPCWVVPTRVDLSAAGTDTVFRSISVGAHSCAISTSVRAYCWGAGDPQLLGLKSGISRASRPWPVETALLFQSVSVGADHTCALALNGEAYCWGGGSAGRSTEGQLGDGTDQPRTDPVAVTGGLRFRSIAAGNKHTCGITLDGVGYCWGANAWGQLGIGSQSASLLPARILGQ